MSIKNMKGGKNSRAYPRARSFKNGGLPSHVLQVSSLQRLARGPSRRTAMNCLALVGVLVREQAAATERELEKASIC